MSKVDRWNLQRIYLKSKLKCELKAAANLTEGLGHTLVDEVVVIVIPEVPNGKEVPLESIAVAGVITSDCTDEAALHSLPVPKTVKVVHMNVHHRQVSRTLRLESLEV